MYGIFTYIYHKFAPNVGKYLEHLDITTRSSNFDASHVIFFFLLFFSQPSRLASGKALYITELVSDAALTLEAEVPLELLLRHKEGGENTVKKQ